MPSFTLADNNDKKYENPPAGTHLARLVSITDLGTQKNKKNPDWAPKQKVRFGFAFPYETFKDKDGNEFALVAYLMTDISFKYNGKTKFEELLNAIMGSPTYGDTVKSADGKTYSFKFEDLINRPVQATVVLNGEYADVVSVAPVAKGIEVPEVPNEKKIFDLENYSDEAYEKLPEWMRNMIALSPEYKTIKGIAIEDGEFRIPSADVDWLKSIYADNKALIDGWRKKNKIFEDKDFTDETWATFLSFMKENGLDHEDDLPFN